MSTHGGGEPRGVREQSRATRDQLVHVAEVVDRQITREAGNYYGNRKGFCDQCNGIFVAVANNLGIPAVLVRGYVEEDHHAHTWARVGNLNVDVAGEQYGRPQVRVFRNASDRGYHPASTERLGERIHLYDEDQSIVEHATEQLQASE